MLKALNGTIDENKETLFLSVALENNDPFESIYLAETVLPY